MTSHTAGYVTAQCEPLGEDLSNYNRGKQRPARKDVPTPGLDIFADAMYVREEVFVKEQGVPLDNELDSDDAACVHVVLYQRSQDDAGADVLKPAGTIRMLPLDNRLPEHLNKHRKLDGSPYASAVRSTQHADGEAFVTLGRLAILRKFRGRRWAEPLVNHVVHYAAEHPQLLERASGHHVPHASWKGLVMIHAQVQAQRFWERVGFTVDNDFGIWDEEDKALIMLPCGGVYEQAKTSEASYEYDILARTGELATSDPEYVQRPNLFRPWRVVCPRGGRWLGYHEEDWRSTWV